MTHVIFDLCIRDCACVDDCPVECIVAGEPDQVADEIDLVPNASALVAELRPRVAPSRTRTRSHEESSRASGFSRTRC